MKTFLLFASLIFSLSALSQTTTTKDQCAAITQAGTQCKRTVEEFSMYCWQHAKTKVQREYETPEKETNPTYQIPSEESTSQQCIGMTQSGNRCKRMVKGGNRCYQH